MKTIDLEIITYDKDLESDLVERMEYSTNATYELPIGTITLGYKRIVESVDAPDFINAVLAIGAGVTSSMISNWLWSKLKGKRVSKLKINHRVIEFEEGNVRKIVEETIDLE